MEQESNTTTIETKPEDTIDISEAPSDAPSEAPASSDTPVNTEEQNKQPKKKVIISLPGDNFSSKFLISCSASFRGKPLSIINEPILETTCPISASS